jgi:SpoIID/LytB domain protein
MKKIFGVILLAVLMMGVIRSVDAVDCGGNSECMELEKEISKLSEEVSARSAANEKNAGEMRALQAKVRSLQAQIGQAESELIKLEDNLKSREESAVVQYKVLSVKTREFYKNLRGRSILSFLFSSLEAGEISRDLAYRSQSQDQDRQIILQISREIIEIEGDKLDLEERKVYLSSLSGQLDKQAKFLEGEVAGVSKYIGSLEGKIAALSTKQQSIIGQRLASLNLPTSLGAGLYCTDDRNLDPGFSSAFAFYTFGIPHRVGMNQYGAYGRAKVGQSAEVILQAYFQNFQFKEGFEGRNVVVDSEERSDGSKIPNEHGQVWNSESMNVEEYLKHLYEMPSDWDSKALEAQAIAARSYALYEMDAKGFVYPSQRDQVIKKEFNATSWVAAVLSTKGKIMVQNDKPIKAWYSSTDGGYTFTSSDVWGGDRSWTKRLRDVSGDVDGFSDLISKSYDKESPCFYAAQGWRNEYGKSAWLKSSEVADLVNVLLLAEADSSSADHLYQTDKPHPYGGEVWNEDKVRQELRNKNITPFNNVSSVSIAADFGVGKTTNVSISGDGGSKSFSGDEFRNYFNLRAPANIQIVGSLFNIEKK